MRLLRIASFSIWLSWCLGCDRSPPTSSQLTQLSAEDLFRLHCSACHGDGTGNGHIASALKVRPRNLALPEWQAKVDDAHIARVIRGGGAVANLSAEMPAFRDKLSERDVQLLVFYLRRLGSW